ncbi:conserved hypothetical protein [Nitrobacter winogradskyi Nb-255]|uniref:PIN domain-containing protein n=1 Tax=Nitrobacter winogradskyi (strain ATCC 25391 / DSM 10237 / CIP 104748 / NCIMB 11846 / Nb-255) TaxID=323098 RepID=Q3SW08_NITWN|nr:hypothetical protein [Nitrobacter winogradskyi]ABA03533.1 conserved hypothetical protein [Nitrobacter winogradskyi Nb-255]
MSSSSFPIDAQTVLVADASVAINLNATGCALEIIRAQPGAVVITENALAELAEGRRNGHRDYDQIQALIAANAMQVFRLDESGNKVYASLVDGTAIRTLDDGEAATIGFACQTGAIALIDERKAQSICAADFPALRVVSTVDFLTHSLVADALGESALAQAIVNALRNARMRVPPHQMEMIVKLIGEEAALNCTSLPKAHRAAAV